VGLFRKSDEEDDAQDEPPGRSLIIRADHFQHAMRLHLSIFGPGTPLAIYAEKLRAQQRRTR
jgi:hypothetical protein